MPLDGIFLKNLCSELSSISGSRIDKIFQPSRDELILLLRSAGFSGRLLLSSKSGMARVHLTKGTYENPAVPPMFCMLMRKHLSGAKLLDVTTENYERVITFHFSATDEMGDRRTLRLIAELIGNQSNIILVNDDGKIIDALRRSDIEQQARLVQPGAVYTLPESLCKKSIESLNLADCILNTNEHSLSGAILSTVSGVSPLIAREVSFLADPLDRSPEAIEKGKLCDALCRLKEYAENGKPYMLLKQDGSPRDFSYMPITQYGKDFSLLEFSTFSELLDAFYEERDRAERLRLGSADITRLLKNLTERTARKLYLRQEELKKCAEREKYRIYGELIKANIALIPRGVPSASVPNYYDENLNNITIPLNPALSPAENSAKYFKEYRKLCNAESTLYTLIKQCEQEAEYIASVSDALSRVKTAAEITEIKQELTEAGYIRRSKSKAQKQKILPPREFISPDGYKILVGRNNMQNDILTLRTAEKTDIWLHTKDIHGSHVIILCGGITPPDSTLLFAAKKAAEHSQAANSSQVPVDYTLVKYVKKPSGAKPGMVIYTHQSTIFVKPNED